MSTVDDYLAKLDVSQQAALQRIRAIIHQTVPEAQGVISYGMPGYKYKGNYLVGFAAFKNHLSLFPTSHPIEALKDHLKDFKLSTGTIQFTPDKPIPEGVIKNLIEQRLHDIETASKR